MKGPEPKLHHTQSRPFSPSPRLLRNHQSLAPPAATANTASVPSPCRNPASRKPASSPPPTPASQHPTSSPPPRTPSPSKTSALTSPQDPQPPNHKHPHLPQEYDADDHQQGVLHRAEHLEGPGGRGGISDRVGDSRTGQGPE